MDINNRVEYFKKILAQHQDKKSYFSVPKFLENIFTEEEYKKHIIFSSAAAEEVNEKINNLWNEEYEFLNKIIRHIGNSDPNQISPELISYAEKINNKFEILKKIRVNFFNEILIKKI